MLQETLLAPFIINDYNDADDVVYDDRENRRQKFSREHEIAKLFGIATERSSKLRRA